jgi:putative transposase
VRFAFVARYRPVWPTRVMCRLLGVSASGFYEWFGRPQSTRALANARLLVRIRESFALSGQTYGSPRVWKDMVVAGESCSENRVARLMSVAQLSAQPKPRRKPTDVGLRPEHCIAPNVLERDFAASGPNRKWAADFTYIWTGEGWLYVAVVVDLYSRLVVGWSMRTTMTAQLVLDALMMALWRRGKPTELLHHSDQGSQGGFNWSSQHL